MVVVFFAIFNDRDHTSVRGLTERVFKLNRCVIDSKIMQQPLFHVSQDAFAHGRGNVGN